MGIISGIQDFINSFTQPKPIEQFAKSVNPDNINLIYTPGSHVLGAKGSNTPSPTASPMPSITPQPTAAPADGQFRYRMGSNDYSDVAPQVQQALKGTPLEPYTNDFIQAGNKHGVDPRVLPTVAFNESGLGQRYPTDTFNPFGYDARSGGMIQGKDGKMYVNVDQGLRNAGFTSLPMAIDRLTQRFSDHPVNATGASYKEFRDNPTMENLWKSYNAAESEKENYLNNGGAFIQQHFK